MLGRKKTRVQVAPANEPQARAWVVKQDVPLWRVVFIYGLVLITGVSAVRNLVSTNESVDTSLIHPTEFSLAERFLLGSLRCDISGVAVDATVAELVELTNEECTAKEPASVHFVGAEYSSRQSDMRRSVLLSFDLVINGELWASSVVVETTADGQARVVAPLYLAPSVTTGSMATVFPEVDVDVVGWDDVTGDRRLVSFLEAWISNNQEAVLDLSSQKIGSGVGVDGFELHELVSWRPTSVTPQTVTGVAVFSDTSGGIWTLEIEMSGFDDALPHVSAARQPFEVSASGEVS